MEEVQAEIVNNDENRYPEKITKTVLEIGKLLNGLSLLEAQQVICRVSSKLSKYAVIKME